MLLTHQINNGKTQKKKKKTEARPKGLVLEVLNVWGWELPQMKGFWYLRLFGHSCMLLLRKLLCVSAFDLRIAIGTNPKERRLSRIIPPKSNSNPSLTLKACTSWMWGLSPPHTPSTKKDDLLVFRAHSVEIGLLVSRPKQGFSNKIINLNKWHSNCV